MKGIESGENFGGAEVGNTDQITIPLWKYRQLEQDHRELEVMYEKGVTSWHGYKDVVNHLAEDGPDEV